VVKVVILGEVHVGGRRLDALLQALQRHEQLHHTLGAQLEVVWGVLIGLLPPLQTCPVELHLVDPLVADVVDAQLADEVEVGLVEHAPHLRPGCLNLEGFVDQLEEENEDDLEVGREVVAELEVV